MPCLLLVPHISRPSHCPYRLEQDNAEAHAKYVCTQRLQRRNSTTLQSRNVNTYPCGVHPLLHPWRHVRSCEVLRCQEQKRQVTLFRYVRCRGRLCDGGGVGLWPPTSAKIYTFLWQTKRNAKYLQHKCAKTIRIRSIFRGLLRCTGKITPSTPNLQRSLRPYSRT